MTHSGSCWHVPQTSSLYLQSICGLFFLSLVLKVTSKTWVNTMALKWLRQWYKMQEFKNSIDEVIWHLSVGQSCLKSHEDILHCLPSYICLFSDQLCYEVNFAGLVINPFCLPYICHWWGWQRGAHPHFQNRSLTIKKKEPVQDEQWGPLTSRSSDT